MALYTPYTSKESSSSGQTRTTEFEVLKASHQFLRKDDDIDENQLSWDKKLAKKYYSTLYREYAVCDLKHYKTGNFSLRWRTEEEVLTGAGETTCGNTRCPLHKEFPESGDDVSLTTLELPFSYMEHGENKFALVKVVLCAKCCKKLMWKRNKEKEEQTRKEEEQVGNITEESGVGETRKRRRSHISQAGDDRHDRKGHVSYSPLDESDRDGKVKRKRRSRCQSPRR